MQFSAKIADLAKGVNEILAAEHKRNATFAQNFQSFADLCRQSINPDLGDPAIQNMLVQHLLTERIFRKGFNNSEFSAPQRPSTSSRPASEPVWKPTTRTFTVLDMFPLLHYRKALSPVIRRTVCVSDVKI